MMANNKQFLHAWIVEKLQESNENNFVGLLEIKKKYNSDVTSSAIGNVICQIFMNVKIKSGRSKENWCKSTQRYYGLSFLCKHSFLPIKNNEK
jgi:hypothetical protein